jgi:hypothetical protein
VRSFIWPGEASAETVVPIGSTRQTPFSASYEGSPPQDTEINADLTLRCQELDRHDTQVRPLNRTSVKRLLTTPHSMRSDRRSMFTF